MAQVAAPSLRERAIGAYQQRRRSEVAELLEALNRIGIHRTDVTLDEEHVTAEADGVVFSTPYGGHALRGLVPCPQCDRSHDYSISSLVTLGRLLSEPCYRCQEAPF